MDRTLLTKEDREWLAKFVDTTRKGCDFILYNLRKRSTEHDPSHAGAVPIWYEGNFVLAADVLRAIERTVPYSQIFEQWESYVYQEVVRTCEKLSAFDSRVLLMASGFHLTTEAEILRAAGVAVDEAYEALYGSFEDHHLDEPYA
jgi:hypothetical protein